MVELHSYGIAMRCHGRQTETWDYNLSPIYLSAVDDRQEGKRRSRK